ncbi:GNAT family N-acetyltransferase [Streptomyces sp. WAC06614]|uniref:GNAT family N-acetyltransferase n=1 Tax=Streptomyces sp. WAC06614 TaxID=2487416 RepID=UPI000F7AA90B|nr:GNAT family N-acetyltransferase [Streptomyces sp. WAC06614]RSS80981.1 GNAT family N-acetyltransferase [Streptomyces sp. WAC06614]
MTSPQLTAPTIRRLTLEDLARCADLSDDRGWPREEHKWGLLLSAGTGYGVDAPDGHGLAAACVVTSYGASVTAPELAAVGMVLVAERYARQGLGRRLMTHVCDNVLQGVPLTLHATPFGQPLYEDLGFQVVGRTEMLTGPFSLDIAAEPGAGPAATPARSTVRPATAEDLPRILALDAEVFGTDRTHVLTRLPAFSDLFLVAEDTTGRLTGYTAAWPNMQTHVIGPLIAEDTATAQALVGALAARTDRPLRTDIDVRHHELIDWLKAHGMQSVAFNAVMTRSVPDLPGDRTRRWAPLTVAAG